MDELGRSGEADRHMSEVVLYTKPGCSLCDAARRVLVREGVAFREVDINADAALKKEYGWFIPVVEIEGEWVFEAGMTPDDLPDLLRG